MKKWDKAREKMVVEQIKARGIHDQRVLEAMSLIPRHLFIQSKQQQGAYEDAPLAIGLGQTISQPYIVALMTEKLNLSGNEKVLEIGTGSGYQTAILAELAAEVFSIERHEALARKARQVLFELGYRNVSICIGDGSAGLAEKASFDRIIVTAGAPKIPEKLLAQLRVNGKIVIPVGDRAHQELIYGVKLEDKLAIEKICGCIFVPLIGENGWEQN